MTSMISIDVTKVWNNFYALGLGLVIKNHSKRFWFTIRVLSHSQYFLR